MYIEKIGEPYISLEVNNTIQVININKSVGMYKYQVLTYNKGKIKLR